MKKILWIEDDYKRLKGLIRPLKKHQFQIDYATDYASFMKMNKPDYDLYIVDLILPQKEEGEIVTEEEFIEITGGKVVDEIKKTDKPIIIVTVVKNHKILAELQAIKNVRRILEKGELFPSDFKSEIFEVLGMKNDN